MPVKEEFLSPTVYMTRVILIVLELVDGYKGRPP